MPDNADQHPDKYFIKLKAASRSSRRAITIIALTSSRAGMKM